MKNRGFGFLKQFLDDQSDLAKRTVFGVNYENDPMCGPS
jgi:hypothetical protein